MDLLVDTRYLVIYKGGAQELLHTLAIAQVLLLCMYSVLAQAVSCRLEMPHA